MSNLALAAANKNYYSGILHDVQGELSEVTEKREQLAVIMSESESGTNSAAEAMDKSLEQIQKSLETQQKLIEGLAKAAEDLVKSASKDAAPKFASTG